MESGMGWSKLHIKGSCSRNKHGSCCTALPTSAITKEKRKSKKPFGAFLDLRMLKDRDGVAFQSLNVSILRVAGEHFLSA